MLKNISKLGATLSKEEQKSINGGFRSRVCHRNSDCYFTIGGFTIGPGDTFCGHNNFCQYF